MKTRIVINKPQNKKCEICEKDISLYSFASHLRFSHQISSDDYASKYGEFRKPKRIKNPSGRNINQIECKLCEKTFPSVGMFTHLRDSHDINVDDYCKQFGEYRPSKLRQLEYQCRLNISDNKQTCTICNQTFASGNLLGGHIKRDHLITKREYVLNYVFKGIHPICKCGCGRKVKILYYAPYKVDYINGHNKGTLGFKFSAESKMKMSEKAVIRVNTQVGKKTDTEPELKFKSILNRLNINYIHPFEMDLGNRKASIDFFLTDYKVPVEIDGLYWHPEKMENLNFHRLPNAISDKQKENIPNLIRLKENDIDNIQSFNDMKRLSTISDYRVEYKQKIINKDYFKLCLEKKGKHYLEENGWLLLKFIRTFHPEFPYPPLEENLQEVIKKISEYDTTKIYYKGNRNEFSNNISTIGHNYLKHHFKSYWNGKFNGNSSPTEAWNDDEIMLDVIKYRIGCNSSNEVFDFSLHQLIRGLSARRITISFFKPLLAAAIYKHYIGNKPNPIVLDPCCGFGGRLLGFKSIYPNGKYIGCEPNIETYQELLLLIKNANWKDVEIHNCKFEKFIYNRQDYNLIFTSIPYFDREFYSDNISYESFDHWKNTFIKSIENYSGSRCFINCDQNTACKLNWNNIDSYIISNTTHFDKTSNIKKEVIVSV